MRRELDGGYALDDDPARIDVAAVHRYLSEESYWAVGRSLCTQAICPVEGRWMVWGLSAMATC